MKIYLAARYSRREELCAYRSLLQQEGHVVTSRWLDGDHHITDEQLANLSTNPVAEALGRRLAMEDYEDLLAADACVSFTEEPHATASRGGRHVEIGIAIQAVDVPNVPMSKIVVIGPRENVFHCLPLVQHFDSWPEFITSVHFADWKREA